MQTKTAQWGILSRLRSFAAGIIPTVATLAVGALLLPGVASAQISSSGNDFMVGFLNNTAGGTPDVELHLTSPVGMQVQVEHPVGVNLGAPVVLTPGSVTIVTIPSLASTGWPTGSPAANAVRASSVNPAQRFTCYMINRFPFTSDAGLALPINSLGNLYRVITATPTFGGVFGSQFVVVATQNGTTVTITPSQNLAGGQLAGVPFNVALNRGEGWFAVGAAGDLTGSTVQSSLPVSMVNGVGCVNIDCGACDHVFEVAQPVQTWGTGIPAANLPGFAATGVRYRIMAANANTTILQDGVSIGVLNAGQFLTTPQLTGSHVFDGDQAGSPQPIFVVQFMPGCASGICASGDPAIGNIIPAAQYQKAYTFSTVGAGQFACNFVTIIAANSDVGTLTLDSVAVPAGSFTAIGASGYSSVIVPVVSGVHQTASANGHGLTVEGYNGFDSYLYPGGALLDPINVDLVLTKDDQVSECAAIGGTINYKVCYQNKGNDPANNVVIVDTLPPEVDFVSANGGGVYSSGPRTVTWSVGTAPADMLAPVCFDLVVTVNNTATAGGEIVNDASIDSDEADLTAIQKRTTVCLNQPPVAVCEDVTSNCGGDISAEQIAGGSSDPDGDDITITVSPAGPYPVGVTPVIVTVTDTAGATAECTATVTVELAETSVSFVSPKIYWIEGVGGPPTIKAEFSSECELCDGPVDFWVDLDGDGAIDHGEVQEGALGGDGSWSVTLPGVGIYCVQALYGGSEYCAASATEVLIVSVVSPGDLANGGGRYARCDIGGGNPNVVFGFTTQWDKKDLAYRGNVLVQNNKRWRVKGKISAYAQTSASTGEATGLANVYWWDASLNDDEGGWAPLASDVRYKISFVDIGNLPAKRRNGAKLDSFGLTFLDLGAIDADILDAVGTPPVCGAPQELKNGNVSIH